MIPLIGILCIAVLLTFMAHTRRQYPFAFLSHEMKENFYNIMEKFDQICKDHNLKYFIVAGTLLGSVRHKDIIPWDDDIDVGMLEEDAIKLKNLDLSSYGLKTSGINRDNIGKVMFNNNEKSLQDIYIDIFMFEQVGDKYMYTQKFSRQTWPNEYFLKDELFPLKKYKFNRLQVNGPAQYLPYCERSWGKNWSKPKFKTGKMMAYPLEMFKIWLNGY